MPTCNQQEEIWGGPKGDKYVRRFFWSPAEVDAHWLKYYSIKPRTQIIAEALEGIPRDISILEIGCNCGNQLEILNQMGFTRLFGTDINTLAIRTIEQKRKQVSARVAKNDELPFADGKFDMVMTCWTLCHMSINNYAKALREIKRVTKRWLFISEPYSRSECELQEGYLWSRPVAADIDGEYRLVHHQFVQAVNGKWNTGVFLFDKSAV